VGGIIGKVVPVAHKKEWLIPVNTGSLVLVVPVLNLHFLFPRNLPEKFC